MKKAGMIKFRYHLLDEFRGFVLLNMIAYHALWVLVYMYGIKADWYKGMPGNIWQKVISSGFIFLSGFCWQMGKKPLERGCLIFGGGVIITIVTLLIIPESKIVFGVLTFLGSAMLILILLSKVLKRIPAEIGFFASVLLFFVAFPVNKGYLGFANEGVWKIPKGLYANLFTAYLGFPEKGFYSTDYFSVFPWIFLYISGYFAYTILKKREWLNWAKRSICGPLGFVGRNSFLIYMLHQPVICGIFMLVFGY